MDPAVAVITTLDLEHTRILGSTLPEIAAEKAGIIKPGRPCVSATEADSPAGKVIARIAAERGARLLVIGREIEIRRWAEHAGGNRFDLRIEDRRLVDVSLGARGRHQTVNAALAIAALHLLESDGRIRFDEDRIRLALARPRLPARLELFPPRGERRHPVLLDCAHTPSSMAAFTAVSAELFGDDRPDVLIGMLVDKLHERCLETLRGTVRRVAVTAPPSPRALPAPELARIVQRVVAPERIEVVDSPLPWLDARAADPHPLAVIGSVYLDGLVRGHLV